METLSIVIVVLALLTAAVLIAVIKILTGKEVNGEPKEEINKMKKIIGLLFGVLAVLLALGYFIT